jgi:predicted PurR-regulated permease PerM
MFVKTYNPVLAFIYAYLYMVQIAVDRAKRSLLKNRRGAVSMGKLFIAFILIIIGVALTPTIVEQVGDVTGTGGNNLTGSAAALMSLLPMFWVIGILGVAVALIYLSFKESSTS